MLQVTAQQNWLCSPPPPGLVGDVQLTCMPSPGAHTPHWGIFLQLLSLLMVAAGKCYPHSTLSLLTAIPWTGCVLCQGSCGLWSCSQRAPRGFSFAHKDSGSIPMTYRKPSMKKRQLCNSSQDFGFYLNVFLFSLSPLLQDGGVLPGSPKH